MFFFVFFSSRVCFSFCWLPLESSQLEVISLFVNCLLFIIIVTTVTMIISIVTTLTKISIFSNKIFTWRSVRQASPGTLAGWSLSTSLANCKTSRSHWSKLYIPFVGIRFTSSMFVAHLYISGRLGLASQWKTGKPPDKDPLVAKRPFLEDIFV